MGQNLMRDLRPDGHRAFRPQLIHGNGRKAKLITQPNHTGIVCDLFIVEYRF